MRNFAALCHVWVNTAVQCKNNPAGQLVQLPVLLQRLHRRAVIRDMREIMPQAPVLLSVACAKHAARPRQALHPR